MLEDDPNFLPELDLLQVNLEMSDLVTDLDSLRESSQITPEGPEASQRSYRLDQNLAGALVMPPSASSFPDGPVGGGRKSSVRGDSGAGSRIGAGFFQQDEAHGLLEDDLGMQMATSYSTKMCRRRLFANLARLPGPWIARICPASRRVRALGPSMQAASKCPIS
jgi:hypothetical protein